ncbi:hypothetical protein PVMG_06136, partial [Plasmodium vivax Mauritania I]
MSCANKFKLNIKVPHEVKTNEKYKEILRRLRYALVEYCENYTIEQDTVVTHVKCRNLNYFIDNLRDEFNEHVAPLIKNRRKKNKQTLWDEQVEENILKHLQKETENSCPRNPTPYNKEIRILRKEMEDYCDERDELIGELNSRGISEKEKCDKFRRWTLEYLVNFWNDHFWRKYITYKALIEPFDINNMCSVITLFDNKFNCENDGDFRLHLPAHIRNNYPTKKIYIPKEKVVPTNTNDKIALEHKTPQSYVDTTYIENSTREVPQLGKSPEIPDTVFYPNIPTNIQSTSPKVKSKQDPPGRNEYKSVKRVSLETYIPKYISQQKAASVSLRSNTVTTLAASTPNPVSSTTSSNSAPALAISQIPTGSLSIPIAGGSSGIFHPIGNIQEQGGTLKTAPTSQIDQGNFLIAPGTSFITTPIEELSIFRYSSIIPVLVGSITIFILLNK